VTFSGSSLVVLLLEEGSIGGRIWLRIIGLQVRAMSGAKQVWKPIHRRLEPSKFQSENALLAKVLPLLRRTPCVIVLLGREQPNRSNGRSVTATTNSSPTGMKHPPIVVPGSGSSSAFPRSARSTPRWAPMRSIMARPGSYSLHPRKIMP